MSITTEVLPVITEAMTPAEINTHCRILAAVLGPKTIARVGVAYHHGPNQEVSVSLDAPGISYRVFFGSDWAQAFGEAHKWAGPQKQVRRNNIIRKMALAIISVTDEFGECAEARLRAADFSREEITEFHEQACARASEMCASAPFSVLMEMV